jgi:pSer/pThr/pTyr-binding forkhead associated (FHA) protein
MAPTARPVTIPPPAPAAAFVAPPVPSLVAAPAAPVAPAPVAEPVASTVQPIAQPSAQPIAQPIASTLPPLGAGPVCPACSTQNAPGVRFCGACGTRVDGGAPTAPPQDAGAARTMFLHAQPEPQRMVKLVTIDQAGREGMTFMLRSGETLCGRINGIVLFDDPYVSPTHCKFTFGGGRLQVQDLSSLNGVYQRIRVDRKLDDGDQIRIGRQLFRFERLDSAALQVKTVPHDDSKVWGSPLQSSFGRIVQILDDGRTGEIRLLQGDRVQLGRELGDIVMPWDGFVSGRHCVFTRQGADVVLADLGSSNGTYVRVRGEAELVHGDFLLVGNQMLRVEIV